MTASYITDYIQTFISVTDGADLEAIQIQSPAYLEDPVRIAFNVRYEFTDDSTSTPSQAQINNLLIQAFQLPSVQALLVEMNGISSSNPFSTVIDASYMSQDGTVFSAVQGHTTAADQEGKHN